MRDSYVSHTHESAQEKAKSYFHHGCLLNNVMIEIYQTKDGEKERRKERKAIVGICYLKREFCFQLT